MRTVPWDRDQVIREIRNRIWTHLSPTLAPQALALDASKLLQVPEHDLQALARLQFMTSDEVCDFLAELPLLLRSLNSTTTHDEERSFKRLRGPIQWSATIAGRLATGQPQLYVTRPARRAFQTPENALLAFTLFQVASEGKAIGWQGSKGGVGAVINARTTTADRWRSHRAINEIDPTHQHGPCSHRTKPELAPLLDRRRHLPVMATAYPESRHQAAPRANPATGLSHHGTIRPVRDPMRLRGPRQSPQVRMARRQTTGIPRRTHPSPDANQRNAHSVVPAGASTTSRGVALPQSPTNSTRSRRALYFPT